MLDLNIERLRIEVTGAAGQEHRMGHIAERATALFTSQVEVRYGAGQAYPAQDFKSIAAKPVHVDLSRSSDEHAARSIADAWLEALALRLKS